jgi:hypothetical protein
MDRCGQTRPIGILSPDRPARSQSPYRLSYPVHVLQRLACYYFLTASGLSPGGIGYYVCMYVCMYVRTYVCIYIYVCMYVFMYVCMYLCIYVCMYVCVCVCVIRKCLTPHLVICIYALDQSGL